MGLFGPSAADLMKLSTNILVAQGRLTATQAKIIQKSTQSPLRRPFGLNERDLLEIAETATIERAARRR